jgi:hypothetical protein
MNTLWLGKHTQSRHQISFEFGLNDLRFNASYWYADVDFNSLKEKYGTEFLLRIFFHIVAFTANTLVSLSPNRFDPGPYSRFCTSNFWELWNAIVRGAWGQWRYEHNMPEYLGPELVTTPRAVDAVPIKVKPEEVQTLAFCGGGKDTLVSVKLLQRAGVQFDTVDYSSSIYGLASKQHQLCDSLLDAAVVPKTNRRRIWCYDDLTDSPVLDLYPEFGAHGLTAAETPASVFLALPLVLQHGYTDLCFGHERSADTGNLVWERTGEEINHQWGKSSEAQKLINDYIRMNLLVNCNYFSILKPIYDVLIFNLLNQDKDAVVFTHSCNIQKPWCGRCPKCAYVWINYMAYLPGEVVHPIFNGQNLLDVPENQLSFRQMLGLEAHTPFECIGQIDEVKLAFELCRRKGLKGFAMNVFEREVPPVNVTLLMQRYLEIDESCELPTNLRDKVLAQMRAAAARCH